MDINRLPGALTEALFGFKSSADEDFNEDIAAPTPFHVAAGLPAPGYVDLSGYGRFERVLAHKLATQESAAQLPVEFLKAQWPIEAVINEQITTSAPDGLFGMAKILRDEQQMEQIQYSTVVSKPIGSAPTVPEASLEGKPLAKAARVAATVSAKIDSMRLTAIEGYLIAQIEKGVSLDEILDYCSESPEVTRAIREAAENLDLI
jgi:hypothetical protein